MSTKNTSKRTEFCADCGYRPCLNPETVYCFTKSIGSYPQGTDAYYSLQARFESPELCLDCALKVLTYGEVTIVSVGDDTHDNPLVCQGTLSGLDAEERN